MVASQPTEAGGAQITVVTAAAIVVTVATIFSSVAPLVIVGDILVDVATVTVDYTLTVGGGVKGPDDG